MFTRPVLAATALALGVGAVAAQSDPLRQRKEEMKAIGRYIYVVLNRMQRGQDPYDQSMVDAGFAQLADTAKKLPALFPDNSRPPANSTDEYSASPKVWENKSDFDARLVRFAKEIDEARPKATSLEGLKVAYSMVRQNCDSCHEVYRIKNR